MTIFEWTTIVIGAATAFVIAALIVVNAKLDARLKALADDHAELERKFEAMREQQQHELLALGERVIAADKIVRHFSERLDAIENDRSSDLPQYGQLQNLLKQTQAFEGDASAAEKELLSLLRRSQKLSS